jgi:hypothetical protein
LGIPASLVCFAAPFSLAAVVLAVVALVAIPRSGGRLRGKGLAWTGLLTGLAGAATGIAVIYIATKSGKDAGGHRTPSLAALEAAERNILSDNRGVAHGNIPEAEDMAREFGESLTRLFNLFFERSEGRSGLSLSGDKFVTHCQLGDGTCAFLVHVPSYRKFTREAKESLADIAWTTAQSLAAEHPEQVPPGSRLAVGLKGIAVYGAVITGRAGDGAAPEDTMESRSSDKDDLTPFFAEPESGVENEAEPAGETGVDRGQADTGPSGEAPE